MGSAWAKCKAQGFLGKGSYDVSFFHTVDRCPVCHVGIHPEFINAVVELPVGEMNRQLWVGFQCPKKQCQQFFVAEFLYDGSEYMIQNPYKLRSCFPTTFETTTFPAHVTEISPDFEVIYNQASKAEMSGLSHICGPGFRKALEFLLKDYCIHRNKDAEATIKEATLASCITTYIKDANISQVANRAAWLGNDESHYVRKWVEKDVSDFKTLIALTVDHIKNSLLTEKYVSDMPKPEKPKKG